MGRQAIGPPPGTMFLAEEIGKAKKGDSISWQQDHPGQGAGLDSEVWKHLTWGAGCEQAHSC